MLHYVFFNVSLIFHYFIFYGKNALQSIGYVKKMFAAKMLTVKVPKTLFSI